MFATIALLVLVIIVLILAAVIGLGWYISNRLLRRTPTSTALTIPITAVDGDHTITLGRTKNTQHPGVFGITGTEGQGIVGTLQKN